MNLLTSLLSTIFGLLLVVVVVAWSSEIVISSFGGDNFDLLKLMPVILVVLINWIAFLILEWLYKKVHPKMYNTSWADNESGPGFNIIQSVISALRSAVLGLAIPTISLGLVFIGLAPLMIIMNLGKGMSQPLLSLVVVEILLIGIIGWVVQWRYQRNVLGLMMEKSTTGSSKSNSNNSAGTSSEKLQIRLLDESKTTKLSKRGAEKQKSAIRLQRRLWIRDMVSPLAALTGIIAAAYYLKLMNEQSKAPTIMVWVVFFALGWIGTRWRMADRTPLRQLRLGFGLWFHALLVAFVSPFVFLFELPGHNGKPDEQWTMVPRLGQWVSHLLRSPRLFWIPATFLVSMVPIITASKKVEDLGLEALVLFAVGILSFEIFYRLLDRMLRSGQKGSNSLVFLRVFGDSGRGRFLFTHLVPRWKGMGSITCIAAPDVSVHQLESDIGFDILFARLRQRFLTRNESEVIGRHISSDALGDVMEDHCFDDTWMQAVQSMFTQNAIIMMDLRGFGPQREGCIYELGVLRDNFPMDSVVFLIDDNTDFEFLKTTLDDLWKSVSKDSPNTDKHRLGSAKYSQITIFRMSDSKSNSAKQLTKLLTEACVSTEKYNQGHGLTFLKELIDDLQLLASDADAQIKNVSGRLPGKKLLEAGFSSDHDLGNTSFLVSWGLINDQQDLAINDVNEAIHLLRAQETKLTSTEVKTHPAWQELRLAARQALKALGKRRNL